MSIRFEDILATTKGKDDAFEELTCQLARRHPPAKTSEFRRIHGAGGDGGVEAYWVLEDGDEVGYQAKYYLKSGDVRWDAIDKSVDTALTLHPRLRTYYVAIACDLTDKTERPGKTGWQMWAARKKGWEELAQRRLGHAVTFVPWTAFELRSMLNAPQMTGLREHWFGELALTPEWLSLRVDNAVVDLDHRYHAEDHVHVGIEQLFDVIVRSNKVREYFSYRLTELQKDANRWLGEAPGMPAARLPDAKRALSDVIAVVALQTSVEAPLDVSWDANKWVAAARTALGSVSALATLIRDDNRALGRNAVLNTQDLSRGLGQVASHLELLGEAWSSIQMRAERDRAALLKGQGGSGKSHLLADQARQAAAERRPVVLVLGQYLTAGAVWPQILERLGLQGFSSDTFLQALDSAAEAVGKRALFLVDALNEGAGAPLWRKELGSFLAGFKPFSNIACVLSCRSEYLDLLVPQAVARALATVTVRGFATLEEQEGAAAVYMDRNGIARPNLPWLAEEFRNPLFLRSVCLALRSEGGTEFPRGLSGIKKILSFYLSSVARHLAPEYDGSDRLVAPTRRTVLAIARAMASARRDYLSRDDADAIARSQFGSFNAPAGSTWLEVLHRNGLVRFDPDPDLKRNDPLPENVDVVRFAFQRFQDHLMAEALLAQVGDVKRAFDDDGELHFLTDLAQWRIFGSGLLSALAIQIPELFGQELVDVMPGGLARWRGHLMSAFEDSLALRASDAFSARTTSLFQEWVTRRGRAASILLQLSIVTDHPWNADGMHERLRSVSMPERDLRWTHALNDIAREDTEHAFHVLAEWCASPAAAGSSRRTRELAALALAWCLTSSNRPVRDKATKALSRLMLIQEDLLPYLVGKLKDVDDNYVLERLWAAAFGACAHDSSLQRLELYANLAWHTVFSSLPRKDLLLRDYARATIELATHVGARLNADVDLRRCRPPYAELGIDLGKVREITRAEEKKMGDGAQQIVSSCLRYGDFGDYEIKPPVREITTVPVTALPIVTKESAFREFRDTVLAENVDRMVAFKQLQEQLWAMRAPEMKFDEGHFELKRPIPSKKAIAQAEHLASRLLALLSPEEVQRFQRDAVPWLHDTHAEQAERVDVTLCQTWVARRAIELGGAAIEVHGPAYTITSERPAIERLSKKYQWLALSELLCGLGSTFCLESGWQEDQVLHPFDLPTDFGFTRDIDPTVLSHDSRPTAKADDGWMFGPSITLDAVSEDRLSSWPLQKDPGHQFDKLIGRTGPDGRCWFVVYDHTHKTEHYQERHGEHGLRQQEFRRIFSVFVESPRLEAFISHLKTEQHVDVSNWEVPQLTDGPYLGEIFWRMPTPLGQWLDRGGKLPASVRLAFPAYQYVWESHLDCSLADGARTYLPAPWLAKALGWNVQPSAHATGISAADGSAFVCKQTDEDTVALLSGEALERLESEAGLSCVWLLVAERNAWPGGNNAAGAWRRAEGVAWMDKGRLVSSNWTRDGSAIDVASGSRTTPRRRGGK